MASADRHLGRSRIDEDANILRPSPRRCVFSQLLDSDAFGLDLRSQYGTPLLLSLVADLPGFRLRSLGRLPSRDPAQTEHDIAQTGFDLPPLRVVPHPPQP